MVIGKFHNEDLGTVLLGVKCLSWNIPIDGSEGVSGPACVPIHELLANSWAAGCLSEWFGEAWCDSFTIDSEAG